jgi:polysaccharide transporter, PST family
MNSTRPADKSPRALRWNAAFLYGAHAVRYLVPLVTIPFLTRAFGPSAFGRYVFVQGFCFFMMQLIEYGFGLSNVRVVALHREDRRLLGELVSGTACAQLLLALLGALITLAAYAALPQLRADSRLLAAGFGSIVVQALAPSWFFKGMEMMHTAAGLDVVSRLVRMLLIFALIRSPADTWLAFCCDASAGLLVLLLSAAPIYRNITPSLPSSRALLGSLRTGFATFVVRISTNLFSSGSVFVLGLAVPAARVGLFGGADRIVTTLRSALNPAFDAWFPSMTRLAARSPAQAKQLIWRSLFYAEAVAVPLALGLLFFAPLVVRVLLGPQFAGATDCLRILALSLPLATANLIFGTYWLYLQGYERLCSYIALASGLFNLSTVSIAVSLHPEHGHIWAAVCYVAAFMVMQIALGYATRSVGLRRFGERSVPSHA